MKLSTAVQMIEEERDRAADNALRIITKIKQDLDRVAAEISDASAGVPARPDYLTPNARLFSDLLEYGSTFRALWQAAGYLKNNATEEEEEL